MSLIFAAIMYGYVCLMFLKRHDELFYIGEYWRNALAHLSIYPNNLDEVKRLQAKFVEEKYPKIYTYRFMKTKWIASSGVNLERLDSWFNNYMKWTEEKRSDSNANAN